MRPFLFSVLLACVLLFLFCHNDQQELIATPQLPISAILLTDNSNSDWFIRPDTVTLRMLFSPYLMQGLEISAVSVNSDSYHQTVYYSGLLKMDTPLQSSNFIKNRKYRKENQKCLANSNILLQAVLDSLQKRFINIPKCDSSDVNNALTWVNIAATNAVKKGHNVIIILASDLVQDLIKYVQETAQPVHFPPGIQIVVIGHHPSVNLEQLFPEQKPLVLPSFQHLQNL